MARDNQGNEQGIKAEESVVMPVRRYASENKLLSLKEEILRIPKVKQILQKDKFVYTQDIEKRLELIGNIKNEEFVGEELADLHDLQKRPRKKTKRHQTNFKIPLTRQNVKSLSSLLKEHISHNQKYKNEEVLFLKEYNKTAPFDLAKLRFMDELNPIRLKYRQQFPDFKEGVLQKNKLMLEHVILNRNIKREMKLDKKKESERHAARVLKADS